MINTSTKVLYSHHFWLLVLCSNHSWMLILIPQTTLISNLSYNLSDIFPAQHVNARALRGFYGDICVNEFYLFFQKNGRRDDLHCVEHGALLDPGRGGCGGGWWDPDDHQGKCENNEKFSSAMRAHVIMISFMDEISRWRSVTENQHNMVYKLISPISENWFILYLLKIHKEGKI